MGKQHLRHVCNVPVLGSLSEHCGSVDGLAGHDVEALVDGQRVDCRRHLFAICGWDSAAVFDDVNDGHVFRSETHGLLMEPGVMDAPDQIGSGLALDDDAEFSVCDDGITDVQAFDMGTSGGAFDTSELRIALLDQQLRDRDQQLSSAHEQIAELLRRLELDSVRPV